MFITNFIYYTPWSQSKVFDDDFFSLSAFIHFLNKSTSTIQFYMKSVMNIHWNTLPYEGKNKILYNNDENTILYNEYMMKII